MDPFIGGSSVGGGNPRGVARLHLMGARLDGRWELEAGCFSRDPKRNAEAAARLLVPAERRYPDYQTMAAAEAKRPDRVDLVAIVTPNETHVPIARAFVAQGFNVLCEKPLAVEAAPALKLRAEVRRAGTVFALAHYFAGFPMLRQARAMVAGGGIGEVRMVQAEHVSEGLTLGRPDARPPVGVIADLAVHAAFTIGFVSGRPIEKLCADAHAFTPGRKVEDDARLLLKLKGGGRGAVWVSHAAAGLRRSIALRVTGSKGTLEWKIAEPDTLRHTASGEPTRLLQRGMDGLDASALAAQRIPSGHAEGTIESFATLYRDLAEEIGKTGKPALYPTIDDAVMGAAFIETAYRSAANGGAWRDMPAL
jgi:predicted dehydrogenase